VTRYLLDTNIWIAAARGESDVLARMREAGRDSIVCCSVVEAELMYGARKSARVAQNLLGFEGLLAPFEKAPFDSMAAAHYGLIRAVLERAGTPIGGNDLMVAAIGLAREFTVVTRNVSEFLRVPGLRVEEW
jgi:tRNA(fMet)-specific endonuclease VapC